MMNDFDVRKLADQRSKNVGKAYKHEYYDDITKRIPSKNSYLWEDGVRWFVIYESDVRPKFKTGELASVDRVIKIIEEDPDENQTVIYELE